MKLHLPVYIDTDDLIFAFQIANSVQNHLAVSDLSVARAETILLCAIASLEEAARNLTTDNEF